ncbi:FAD-dependent monooxygenase [Actinomadura harenae]|uniref:FAD-binding domain-containing protein n=1 Tax=Actinomadura harenae TaxID=2483351 RepID=A0A3M2M0B0_9ACTN|nr:FAD-dependent monooxygenase [Actinomadura harenae]RMI43204.1 hypothetical protein EBO15_17230 [Actinomadura harenae]
MVDVVVAGGGPVGMFLATELRLAGVEVVVLERSVDPNPHSRAFRLQPRTLDVLDSRGLLDRFRADHLDWPSAHFAGLRPLLDLGRTGGEHPHSLLIPQAHTERILEERAAALGADIRRGHELVGLRQDDAAATARVRLVGGEHAGGEYEISARYLVGCDGGRSAVRRLAEIGFPGTGGRVSALLGDVTLDDPDKLPSGIPGTLRTPAGLLMAVALEPGITRVLTTEFGRDLPDPETPMTLDELRDSVRRVTGEDVTMREPRWLSRFGDATCLADHYRDHRVLLAGDAAHVHFPIGAQGLNLGLQDAVNLGWKLAGEVRGWAPRTLLDSYDRERRPVARAVLRETRAQLALMNPDESINPLRELFGELLALDEVNAYLAALVSGVDVRYVFEDAEDGSLAGGYAPACAIMSAAGATRPAELLRTGRGVALLPEDSADLAELRAGWGDRVDMVGATVKGREGAAALLLRPDGYVAWSAASGLADDAVDGLRRSLTTWCGAPSEGPR